MWEPLGDECLLDTLHASRNPTDWTEQLDKQIKARAKPGHDNYTAVTLWMTLDEDEEDTQLMPGNLAAAGSSG